MLFIGDRPNSHVSQNGLETLDGMFNFDQSNNRSGIVWACLQRATSMRAMFSDSQKSASYCSECGWSFPLGRLTELREYFQERDAIKSFASHDCAAKPATNKPVV